MNGDLTLDLHGLSVSVTAEDEDLRRFVQAHFEAEVGENRDAQLAIRAGWHWGRPAGAERTPPAGARRAGRGLVIHEGKGAIHARWTRVPGFPELTLGFDLAGDPDPRLGVSADCGYVPKTLGRRIEYLRAARAGRKRNRLFFKMMYYMVYYPVAWHLRHSRGWGLIHASAVRLPSGCTVVLAGQGGVGKSSVALALLSRPGARLISDNLLFHDAERIYACPEPVRLDAAAIEGMSGSGIEPERSGLPLDAHPKPTYRVDAARRADAAAPTVFYFLGFGDEPSIRPLEAAGTAAMLEAGNDLALEIKDYRPLAALLSMLAAERGRPIPVPGASLLDLTSRARGAVVTIGRTETIVDTASRLAAAAEAGA